MFAISPCFQWGSQEVSSVFQWWLEEDKGVPLSTRLTDFLLSYRSIPHTTTNRAPCELFLKRQIRTRLDLLRPNCESQVQKQQANQKMWHDQHAHARQFFLGQTVMAQNLRPGPKWVPGVVVECLGPLSYLV